MAKFSDLISDALKEISVIAAGEPGNGDDLQEGLNKLNDLLDLWNSRERAAWSQVFKTYTLTAGHQPHLLGPGLSSPDFNTQAPVDGGTVSANSSRPSKIYAAAIVFNNLTPNVTAPIPIKDAKWWAYQRVKSLSSNVPTALYPQMDFPNLSLFLWPVPNFAYGLELETRGILSQVKLSDPVSLPPGYKRALTLSLAEELLSCFPANGREDARLVSRAQQARQMIFNANSQPPTMETKDSGLPTVGCSGQYFNYITGDIG
jgi:hypothetical protein